MLELIFLTIIPVALLLGVTFFIVVTLHELGHAVPALIMTRGDVIIYIGSYGSSSRSFRISMGRRLTLICKYNPLLWYRGCCFAPDYELSINQKIVFVAGGPLASLIGTLAFWGLMTLTQDSVGLIRIVSGSVFTLSLVITILTVFPITAAQYTPSGHPVYNDAYQIISLFRRKFGKTN